MGKRIAGIDMVRGLAIGLVLVRHARPSNFGGAGIAGVVIFFALSGYLITGVLLGDLERQGRVRFGRFYRNRALRLLPALLLFLSVALPVTLALDGMHLSVVLSAVAGLFYVSDLRLPFRMALSMSHLWTLAVEEQFYLVWPVVLLAAWRRNAMRAGFAAAIALSLLASWATVALVHAPGDAYTLPTPWVTALVVGAAGRVWAPRVRALLAGRRGDVLAIIALALVAAFSVSGDAKNRPSTYLLVVPVLALCGLALTVRGEREAVSPVRFLEPLRLLGLISYACYLWSLFVVVLLDRISSPVASVFSIPVTIAVAAGSWVLVERRALAWKARLDERDRRPAVIDLTEPAREPAVR